MSVNVQHADAVAAAATAVVNHLDYDEVDDAIKSIVEQLCRMDNQQLDEPVTPTTSSTRSAASVAAPTKMKTNRNTTRKRKASAPSTSASAAVDKTWTLKYPYDAPYITWTNDTFQYTVQNPNNCGQTLLKLHLYADGSSMTNCCAMYLNPSSDDKIMSTLNKLLAQLKDLWLDPTSGCVKHCCMTQAKMPLCAWRKPSLMNHTAAAAAAAAIQDKQVAGVVDTPPPVEKRKKRNQ